VVRIKKIILVLAALILIQAVHAVDVGLIVDFPNGTIETDCVTITDGLTGRDALEASSKFNVAYAYGGGFVDGINGIMSDNVNMLYWSVWQNNGDIFQLTSVGITELIMNQDGILLGFAYGGFDPITYAPLSIPRFIAYDDVCKRKLKITELKAYVDGDKDSGVDEDGGRIDDVKPGSEVKIDLEISNLYSRSEDIEIENIEAVATIFDIDDGDEMEEESDELEINADDEEKVELIFNIPLDVEEDTYDMTIELIGDDEYGWEYEHTIYLELDVDKENHELKILDADIGPSTIKCDRNVRLGLMMINIGKSDEDVDLTIENEQLGLSIEEDFELSEDEGDNDLEGEYYIKIGDDVEAGTYQIKVTAGYGNKEETETLELNVENCGSTYSAEAGITEYQGVPPGYAEAVQEALRQEAKEEANSKWTIALIVLADIAAVAIGIGIFWALKR
jgi:hypothetical protein